MFFARHPETSLVSVANKYLINNIFVINYYYIFGKLAIKHNRGGRSLYQKKMSSNPATGNNNNSLTATVVQWLSVWRCFWRAWFRFPFGAKIKVHSYIQSA